MSIEFRQSKEGYRRSGRSRHGTHEKIVPAAHVLKIWFAHMFTFSCRKEDSITFYDKKDYTICRGNMQVIVITSSKIMISRVDTY